MAVETRRFTVTVSHSHREQVPNTNKDDPFASYQFRYVKDPDTQEEVEITVDWDRLAARLGQRAATNKSRRAVQGFITARHIRRVTPAQE